MLYISDIDNESFGLSSNPDSVEVVKAKVYYAVCHKAFQTSLISIKNKHRKVNILSSKKIDEISLNGVVYETCWEFVSAFNAMMESDGTSTTTTTTDGGVVPEGTIQTYATEKYLQTKSGKYITIKAA